jgi:hypothetical protein
VGLNPDMASWLNERIAKQREKKLKLTNSTVTLEITCRNLLAENEKALRELMDSKIKYLASCQLVASLEKEIEQLRTRLEP